MNEETHFEFVDGRIYALATPTDTHRYISGAIFAALFEHLKGKRPCRVFKGDMKLRISFPQRKAHCIPDVMVACDPEPRDRRYREEPLLLVEVLSESTRGTDEREKLFS
ncbi:MAG: Uma2 family endonuclease [Roseimicrobium sp.]